MSHDLSKWVLSGGLVIVVFSSVSKASGDILDLQPLANKRCHVIESVLESRGKEMESPTTVTHHHEVMCLSEENGRKVYMSSWAEEDLIKPRHLLRRYLSGGNGLLAFSQIRESDSQSCAWRVTDLRNQSSNTEMVRQLAESGATLENLLNSYQGHVIFVRMDGSRLLVRQSSDKPDQDGGSSSVFVNMHAEHFAGNLERVELHPHGGDSVTTIIILRWQEYRSIMDFDTRGWFEELEDCALYTVNPSGKAERLDSEVLAEFKKDWEHGDRTAEPHHLTPNATH